MSREIKFRAWFHDPDMPTNGEMLDFESAVREGYVEASVESLRPVDECTILMQYTGLKDKNGVEIYEGDIILTADDLRKQSIGGWKPKKRLIEWTDNKEYKTGFNLGKAQNGKCEVIGNIYEHPHLLNGGAQEAA